MLRQRNCCLFVLLAVCCTTADAQLQFIDSDASTGASKAVVVQDRALLQTTQLLPVNHQGALVGAGDVHKQIDQLSANVRQLLQPNWQIIKLNVYVASNAAAGAARKRIARGFAEINKPAVSFVTTQLPLAADVAIDLIIATQNDPQTDQPVLLKTDATLSRNNRQAVYSRIHPSGGRTFYISGQAERGADIAESTKNTMAGLLKTLKHFGMSAKNVVQLKTFFQSMKDVETVNNGIAAFYEGQQVPPVSHVEWKNSTPIEIEMVAFQTYEPGEPARNDTIGYLSLPWLKTSPVYSRATVVAGGKLVFISGLYGKPAGSARDQVADLFDQIKSIAEKTGSDMHHLAKATYYVSDEAANTEFYKIRAGLYHPRRPPAASKATVSGVGSADHALTIDMIAVTKSR